jgi:hypothetical protein
MKTPFIIVAAIALASTVSAQTTVFETGFEVPQTPPPVPGATWQQKGSLAFMPSPKDGDAANQIMECRGSNPGSDARLWLNGVSFPDGAGKVAFDFELRLVRSGSQGFQGHVHIGNFPAAPGIKPDGMAVILSFRGSGRLCTFDGDTETEIGNWKDGEWMSFRVEIDPETKTFSIQQNGELLAADYAFRSEDSIPLRSFGLTYYAGANSGQESAMAIDSFKISKP